MKLRRTCILTGIVTVLAAGAAGTMVAAQSSPSDEPDLQIAGWEISGTEVFGLSMSHRVGINRVQYTVHGGHADDPPPAFMIETHVRGENCLFGRPLLVGDPAPAARARQIRAEMERRMVSIPPECVLSPAENAALIDGFDAAYTVYAARYERLQSEADRILAEQANFAEGMELDMNASADAAPRPQL